jgi:glycine/D-amino acid oxidase-like deaminating enzyme
MAQQNKRGGPSVVVIGAGIVGASIAYHLCRRGASVTIIDERSPGSGASSRSFAWINATAKAPLPYHDLSRRSLEMWGRFSGQLGGDVGLRWGGRLQWVATPEAAEEVHQQVKQLQGWGYPCRIVDKAEMLELEPGLSPGPVTAAIYTEVDGQVDPVKVIDACLQHASQWSLKVHQETPATGLTLAENAAGDVRVVGVETEMGNLPCDVVVLAAGVGITKLAAMTAIDLPQPVSPGVTIKTDPRPPLLLTVPVLYPPQLQDGRGVVHIRQSTDGVVTVGESADASLSLDDSQRHADDVLARAIHYLPALAGAKAIPAAVAYRPMPRDGFPILGFSKTAPNVYVALTHSGVTLAPLIGELAALEIVEGATIEMLSAYRPDRFT